MSVYSTLLFAGTVPSALTDVFVVPAGEVVVVRDIEIFTGASAQTFINVFGKVAGAYVLIHSLQSPPVNSSSQWQGRAVIPSGDALALNCAVGSGCNAYISGYLLA